MYRYFFLYISTSAIFLLYQFFPSKSRKAILFSVPLECKKLGEEFYTIMKVTNLFLLTI